MFVKDKNTTSLTTYLIFFCTGIIACQKVNVFGEIYLGEVFSATVILFNLKRICFPSWLKVFFITALCWFVAQFISDIVNQTQLIKSLKGILVPVFVIMIIIGHQTFFAKRFNYLPMYLFGVFIGVLINRIIAGGPAFIENPWKWGLGSSTVLVFFTWIEFYCHRFKKTYLLIASGVFLVICLANSSRSAAFIILVACWIPLLSHKINRIYFYRFFSTSKFGTISFFFSLSILIFLLDRTFAFIFTFEPLLALLPPEDAIKYSVQASSEWGILIGGRSELLVSLQAFADSPIFGHGSWPEDPIYTYSRLDMLDSTNALLVNDLSTAEANIKSFLIPTHSYLMGAMVWGGLFAGLFWLNAIKTILLGFLKSFIISSPLLVFLSISLTWSILFSPFGADARWVSTVLLWLYLFLSQKSLRFVQ